MEMAINVMKNIMKRIKINFEETYKEFSILLFADWCERDRSTNITNWSLHSFFFIQNRRLILTVSFLLIQKEKHKQTN